VAAEAGRLFKFHEHGDGSRPDIDIDTSFVVVFDLAIRLRL